MQFLQFVNHTLFSANVPREKQFTINCKYEREGRKEGRSRVNSLRVDEGKKIQRIVWDTPQGWHLIFKSFMDFTFSFYPFDTTTITVIARRTKRSVLEMLHYTVRCARKVTPRAIFQLSVASLLPFNGNALNPRLGRRARFIKDDVLWRFLLLAAATPSMRIKLSFPGESSRYFCVLQSKWFILNH